MKSIMKINLSTFKSTSSRIPLKCFMDLSTKNRETIVGFTSPRPSFLSTNSGIRFTLTPKSYKDFSNSHCPMVQGMQKLLISFNFVGNFFYKITLHSSVRAIISKSSNLRFFDKISFMNFV